MKSLNISFVEQIKFSKSNGIVLLRLIHKSGLNLFAYLELTKQSLDQITRCYEKHLPITLSDYGKVLMFGEGEPNEHTKELINALEI